MTSAARVIKLGGSLLEWDALVPSFERWLSAQPPLANVVVVGGGRLVEALRELDGTHGIDPATVHWLSVRAMSMTAELFASLRIDAVVLNRVEDLERRKPALQVLSVESFLREDAGSADALPCSWDVTSDSIAARVATVLAASELVLLKSTLPSGPQTREGWSRSGYVDACFPRASRRVAVRWINLRSADFAEVRPVE